MSTATLLLAAGGSHASGVTTTNVLIALTAVVLVSAVLARAARMVRQPPVIGEIVAGIALGPCVLGLLPGDLPAHLFPTDVRTVFAGVAQIALACYLYTIGQEIDLGALRRCGRSVVTVASVTTVVPLLLGLPLAALLTHWAGSGADRPGFPLFLGVLLSITAVPVLARILDDKGLTKTTPGTVSLGVAALSDLACWLLLAVLVSGTAENGQPWPIRLGLLAAFTVGMCTVGRWVLRRLVTGRPDHRATDLAVLGGALFGSAWATSALGLHGVFGALLCGLVAPRLGTAAGEHPLRKPWEQTWMLLLPAFFVSAGLAMKWPGGGGAGVLSLLAVICTAAVLCKFAAGAVAARLSGMGTADSITVGVLLNTRGLTELVVVNIAYTAGMINALMYTVFVLMTLVTTTMTGPLLDGIARWRAGARHPVPEPALAVGSLSGV